MKVPVHARAQRIDGKRVTLFDWRDGRPHWNAIRVPRAALRNCWVSLRELGSALQLYCDTLTAVAGVGGLLAGIGRVVGPRSRQLERAERTFTQTANESSPDFLRDVRAASDLRSPSLAWTCTTGRERFDAETI